jgi:hypothetical protein
MCEEWVFLVLGDEPIREDYKNKTKEESQSCNHQTDQYGSHSIPTILTSDEATESLTDSINTKIGRHDRSPHFGCTPTTPCTFQFPTLKTLLY